MELLSVHKNSRTIEFQQAMSIIYLQKNSDFINISNSILFLKNNVLIHYHTMIQIQMNVYPSSLNKISHVT